MSKSFLLSVCLAGVPTAAFAQHDRGRNAVQQLAAGELDSAVELVNQETRRRRSPITPAERHFVLAMIACRRGDVATASHEARRAVELGLPVERLQAGPREVFAPLFSDEDFRAWVDARGERLLHGPLLGAVTDVSARFWVRTAAEESVEIEVVPSASSATSQSRVTARARTSQHADYTAVVEVSGLLPAASYQYSVLLDGEKMGPPAQFRTHPKRGAPARFSIGFGGGAGLTPKYERMWTTISGYALRAFFLLGDNVYIDDPTHEVTQRYCYYRRQSRPEWRRFAAGVSVHSIYDDHDFGLNDCIPGAAVDEPAWKRHVVDVFRENWNNPAYGGGTEKPGCWHDFYIGDVHFILLDGRYYRDLDAGSMLGTTQKTWLFDTLERSKGTFKVLASPVPWSPGVKPRSRDTWDGYADEREEIFSFIERREIEGVVLMAADRHRSDLRRIRRPRSYDLYEVMSSRLTNVHTHGLVKNARGSEFIMGYNEKCSFGLMQFDTTLDDPQLAYRIVTIEGEVVGSRVLQLSALSF